MLCFASVTQLGGSKLATMRVKRSLWFTYKWHAILQIHQVPLRRVKWLVSAINPGAFTLAVVQLRLSLQDPALGPLRWLQFLLLVLRLLFGLLHSRHALQDKSPEHVVRFSAIMWQRRNQTHRFPNSRFAPKPLIAIFLWFCCRDFDDSTKQLTLIHVVDRFFCISCHLEFHVAKSSVRIRWWW